MSVAIAIVNYNGRSCLEGCLQSLAVVAPAGTEVVLVDNASTDGSAKELDPGDARWASLSVSVVFNDENRGFAAACNQAARASATPYVLLLNNDVRFDAPEVLARLVGVLEADSRAAAVTPRLLTPGGRDQLPRLGRSWSRKSLSRIPWAPCACLLVRRRAMEEVGWLDEGFFFYNEDLDLARRLRARGWRLLLHRDLAVTHLEGVATDSLPEVRERTTLEGYRGTLRLVRKHHGALVHPVRWAMGAEVRMRALIYRWRRARGAELGAKQQAFLRVYPRLLEVLR